MLDEAERAVTRAIDEETGVTASEAASEARDMAEGEARCEASAAGEVKEAHFGGPIDEKYYFLAWKINDETDAFTEDEAIIFRAKDNALVPTLQFYRDECVRIGASKAHIAGINALIVRVEKWREQNLLLCKVPD